MKNYIKVFLILYILIFTVPTLSGSESKEFSVLDLVGMDIDQMSDAEINRIDIDALIEELEDILQQQEDLRQVKILMNSMQHGGGPGSSVQKTPGQAFGQNDGYVYGNFGRRIAQSGGGRSGPGGPGGGPPGAGRAGMNDFRGGPGGQGGAPGQEGMRGDQTIRGGRGDRGGGRGGGPGGGGSLDFHPLTTPVIEVAEDGQTAKGIWYDPGFLAEPGPGGGGGRYMASWIFECYSQDFVKEDGIWKNWHRCLSTDFFFSPEDNWINTRYTKAGEDEIARIGGILERTQTGELVQVEAPEGSPAGQSFKDIKTVAYQSWTRETMPQYKPKPPVPYKTFSETFSYVPPMPKDIEEMLWEQDMMY